MKYLKSIGSLVVLLLLLVGMGWWISTSETDVLFRAQELSLWLPTKMFYHTSTIYPGGTLTWMAAYMTQFFYHPATGICLLVLAWSIIAMQLCHVFKLRGVSVLMAALVPLALAACLVQTGYWVYYIKLQGYYWVPTLGVLLSLAFAQVHCLLPRKAAFAWFCLAGIAAYPLMGAWGFLAIGLMGAANTLRNPGKTLGYATIALMVAFVLILPKVYCQWMFHQTEAGNVYVAAMPSFQYGAKVMSENRIPYYLLALSFAPAFFTGLFRKLDERLVAVVSALLIAGALWMVNHVWYRDTNFYKEIVMANCIERQDWEGTLRAMRSADYGEPMPPTRVMVMDKNLALFRLGRIGDEMCMYPEGSEQQHAPWQVRMTQVGGRMLYYNYGKEQFCYRWCMEDGVEFGWSVNVLKYMAKASIITEDWAVARKYLDLLKKTRYHHDWAVYYEKFLGNVDLIAQDEELRPIFLMSHFPDRLDGDMTLVEMYLLKTFANGHGADPYYQEMTLVCSMIMKDIDLFWPRFLEYINMHGQEPNFRVPRYYQEAAYLYSMLEPQRPSVMWPGMTNAEALQKLPFDESIKKSYNDFMAFNTQCGPMTEEQKVRAFRPMYGDTFYYFYFLERNRKTN